ncbi:unnamed protein product [Amoebophrya sp. A120]|nr:unnamed protein product [Amoebophrya sp. A120]|eukprot:GSA120T00009574001.1
MIEGAHTLCLFIVLRSVVYFLLFVNVKHDDGLYRYRLRRPQLKKQKDEKAEQHFRSVTTYIVEIGCTRSNGMKNCIFFTDWQW